MGRLIDADKIYESLIERIDWLRKQDYETYCAVGDTIRFVTDQQPTAYDQNKVMEQLETMRMRYYLTYANTRDKTNDSIWEKVSMAVDKTIEIVKGDGI